jgi:hypothetical protein
MAKLHWERKRSGGWVLKSETGQIWAVVTPYRSEHACKNQFKATALNANCAHGNYGPRWWTTGIGVRAAKNNIVRWLSQQSYDGFEVVA